MDQRGRPWRDAGLLGEEHPELGVADQRGRPWRGAAAAPWVQHNEEAWPVFLCGVRVEFFGSYVTGCVHVMLLDVFSCDDIIL